MTMASTIGMDKSDPTDTDNITMTNGGTITDKMSIFIGDEIRVLYTLIGIVGLIGNVLVISVIISSKYLRKKFINMLIANQSCIDAVVSILLIGISTLTTSDVPYQGIGGDIYCLLWISRTFLFGFLLSSTYNLMILTLERYAEIVHPIWHHNHMSLRRIKICIIAVWVFFPLVQGSVTWSTTYVKDGHCFMLARWPNDKVRQIYGIMHLIVKLFIPLIIIVFVYSRIAHVLSRKIQIQNVLTAKLAHSRKNTVKTLFLVSLSFFLCWVCNQVYFFLQNVGLPSDFSSNFYHFTILMVYFNCTINPLIYCLQYEQFQEVALKLFPCKYGRGRVDDSSSITGSNKCQNMVSVTHA